MKHIKYLTVISLLMTVVLAFSNCSENQNDDESEEQNEDMSDRYRNIVNSEFRSMASSYNADTRYLIIVDYSIPSNENRMFIWDTDCNGIIEGFWCAHGLGGNSTAERPEFSNEVGSNCSSLGWFLVDRYSGVSPHWGYQYYAVDGLESTNSNARRRQILIHPWYSVSDDEAAQIDEPMNLDGRCAGCFTTSDTGFETIASCIKSQQKRILLLATDGI